MPAATAVRTLSFVFRTTPNGELNVQAIVHPEFDAAVLDVLGQVAATQPGGRVLPAAWPRRVLFRLVRWLGQRGTHLRAWTRTWRGAWIVDLAPVGGPILGPYAHRSEALRVEAAHLTRLAVQGTVCTAS